MADWTAPFHAPKFTSEEFEERKRKYNEKYGYTITVPTFSDVIHLSRFKPMTEEEKRLWKQRKYDQIPPDRREEIRAEKERKRQRFLAMMGDPTPKTIRDAAAILTAIDDIQDAVSTLAVIALGTAALIGATEAALVTGPIGVILGASTLLSMINPYSSLRNPFRKTGGGRKGKRAIEKLTDKNPFTKKGRLKIAENIKNFKPSLGSLLEVAQTTDQIFGIGISLGPLFGFAQSCVTGAIRSLSGQKVSWVQGGKPITPIAEAVRKATTANALYHMHNWHSDPYEETLSIAAATMAARASYEHIKEVNPINVITDIDKHILQAPTPTDPLTREIIEEVGANPDTVVTWPVINRRWAQLGFLADRIPAKAKGNLKHYCTREAHTEKGFEMAAQADDLAFLTMGALEDESKIKVDYAKTERIVITILQNNLKYPDDITETQVKAFEAWVETCEKQDYKPTMNEIQAAAQRVGNFQFVPDTEV